MMLVTALINQLDTVRVYVRVCASSCIQIMYVDAH